MIFLLRKIVKYISIPFGIMYKEISADDSRLIILMYHRISGVIKKEMCVTLEAFKWHMDYLSKKGYKVITMDEAYQRIKKGDTVDKYVVLTFDDGYEDFYLYAYPILKQYGFKATVYVVSGYVETDRVFWWDSDIGESRLMSWGQIEELSRSGLVDFGSHTLNHHDLDELDEITQKNEICSSKRIVEKRLGKKIDHFSYPRGIYTVYAQKLVQEMYHTGVLISSGSKEDTSALRRVPVMGSDGKYLFVARINMWMALEEALRSLVKRFLGRKI